MNLKATIKRFANEEFGNAVIDWTVLMAGLCLMALAIVATVTDNLSTIADDTTDVMEAIEVNPNRGV